MTLNSDQAEVVKEYTVDCAGWEGQLERHLIKSSYTDKEVRGLIPLAIADGDLDDDGFIAGRWTQGRRPFPSRRRLCAGVGIPPRHCDGRAVDRLRSVLRKSLAFAKWTCGNPLPPDQCGARICVHHGRPRRLLQSSHSARDRHRWVHHVRRVGRTPQKSPAGKPWKAAAGSIMSINASRTPPAMIRSKWRA